MLILSGVLALVWIGVAVIDLFYYRRLLKGAVKSLLALEKSNPRIQLSTHIEDVAARGSVWAPWVFYACGLLPLLVIASWAIYNLRG